MGDEINFRDELIARIYIRGLIEVNYIPRQDAFNGDEYCARFIKNGVRVSEVEARGKTFDEAIDRLLMNIFELKGCA